MIVTEIVQHLKKKGAKTMIYCSPLAQITCAFSGGFPCWGVKNGLFPPLLLHVGDHILGETLVNPFYILLAPFGLFSGGSKYM